MSAMTDLATRVRIALGVNVSYETDTIPDIISRGVNKLLRDYNFPKSLRTKRIPVTTGLATMNLPEGFKKEHMLRVFNPTDASWGDMLRKREGFVLPSGLAYPTYYWISGTKLTIDTELGLEWAGTELVLWYQSMDSADNLDWMAVDFEDVLFTYSVYRGSADVRKPEVMQAYQPLWAEDRQSLAVYLNELEFDNMDMIQHEPRQQRTERYPASVY